MLGLVLALYAGVAACSALLTWLWPASPEAIASDVAVLAAGAGLIVACMS